MIDPRIHHSDSLRTRRLKLLYLIPAGLVVIPVVMIAKTVKELAVELPREIAAAWRGH